jgi:hypothetical protein
MQPIVTNLAALAVAMLFYLWRAHFQSLQRRHRRLCERVTFMLWIMAERIKGSDPSVAAIGRG